MEIRPIATVHSDFQGRFGTPRQPGLVPAARGRVLMQPPYNNAEALRGLEDCSHIWLIFGFDRIDNRDWRPTVRPPRLGGNRRCGVFATRSPFRPNGLGLSLVALEGLLTPSGKGLAIAAPDLLDATPIYDIKPYLPEVEARPQARPPTGFEQPASRLPVIWTTAARAAAANLEPRLLALIEQTVAADPRPAYRRSDDNAEYGMRIAGIEVGWRVSAGTAYIERLVAED